MALVLLGGWRGLMIHKPGRGWSSGVGSGLSAAEEFSRFTHTAPIFRWPNAFSRGGLRAYYRESASVRRIKAGARSRGGVVAF